VAGVSSAERACQDVISRTANIVKSQYTVTLPGKNTRALTFENDCRTCVFGGLG
jgi:hypothetical protein